MSSASVTEAGVGRKKQKASRPQATKKPTVVSREDLLGAEMYQKAKDLQDSTLEALEAIREERISPPKAFLPPARIVQDSPPRAKSSKAKVGESASQVGHDSSSILSTSPLLVVTPTSQFDLSTGEMLYFVVDNSNSSTPTQESRQPTTTTFGEPIVLEIPVVSEVTSLRVSWAASPDVVVAFEVPIS